MLLIALALAVSTQAPAPDVTVREERGVYSVSARFEVPQAPSVALAVLTDYEAIPRFLPDVKTSIVRERTGGRLLVEQEAVARMMLFSKRVRLVLEITQADGLIRFRDRCGDSFVTYEGTWRLVSANGGSVVHYTLTAQPAFDVPEFMLKRLLKRDAGRMIENLAREMASRH
jgi:ribosome-associated toxin RatA of RatAB toxin-antitoxin module